MRHESIMDVYLALSPGQPHLRPGIPNTDNCMPFVGNPQGQSKRPRDQRSLIITALAQALAGQGDGDGKIDRPSETDSEANQLRSQRLTQADITPILEVMNDAADRPVERGPRTKDRKRRAR